MLRRALAAYGKGLDATVRLIGMSIATSAFAWAIHFIFTAANDVLPAYLDWVTVAILILAFPFLARVILTVGGLTISKSPKKLSQPEPPPSPQSLPAGR